LTVRKLFEKWALVELAPHVTADGKRRGRKDGGEYVRLLFNSRVFPTLGDVAVGDVRKTDVLALLDRAKAEGRLRTANMILASLKQMFRFALVREIIERNPADTLTNRDAGGKDVERERVLSEDEIKALAKALPDANLSERTMALIWLILATGVRLGEALKATWADVNMDNVTWHLPETKNQRDHTIHLSAFALAQFEVLALNVELDDDDKPLPWVFPNAYGNAPASVATFGKKLADRQRTASQHLKNRTPKTEALKLRGGRWTAHDLRRSAATLMADLGIVADVIDECLNHVIESRVRRTYIRNRRPVEQARAFDALGKRLAALVAGSYAVSNVRTLGAAQAAYQRGAAALGRPVEDHGHDDDIGYGLRRRHHGVLPGQPDGQGGCLRADP
jgi:integrase